MKNLFPAIIEDIAEPDGFANRKQFLIGSDGTFGCDVLGRHAGYSAGTFYFEDGRELFFIRVKVSIPPDIRGVKVLW